MLLYWEDSTGAGGLQRDMYGYGGYWNGPYRNLSSIRNRFPGKPVMSYATRVRAANGYPAMHGADAVDCEPGCVDVSSPYAGTSLQRCQQAALAFVNGWTGGSGLFSRPLVYMFASWQKPIEDYLTGHGVPRDRFYVNSSHATGRAHFCGPATPRCGFGRTQADMTQYLFAGPYDKSVMQSYMLKGQSPTPTPPVNTDGATVRNGDTGTTVIRVQQRLFNLHFIMDTRQCDGQFGPVTEAAVRAFQKVAGVAQDGIVGPQTWLALRKDVFNPAYRPPPPVPLRPPLPAPVLRRGASGDPVRHLQWYLRNSGLKGVRGITIDGAFEGQTETSVRNFQGYAKLDTDGVYGAATRAALLKVS